MVLTKEAEWTSPEQVVSIMLSYYHEGPWLVATPKLTTIRMIAQLDIGHDGFETDENLSTPERRGKGRSCVVICDRTLDLRQDRIGWVNPVLSPAKDLVDTAIALIFCKIPVMLSRLPIYFAIHFGQARRSVPP